MNEVLDALRRKGEARFNYAILKNTYFRGMTDEECVAEIVAWCRESGLDVEMEHASVAIGNLPARPAYYRALYGWPILTAGRPHFPPHGFEAPVRPRIPHRQR